MLLSCTAASSTTCSSGCRMRQCPYLSACVCTCMRCCVYCRPYDAVVIGLGSHGSACLYNLAKWGSRVRKLCVCTCNPCTWAHFDTRACVCVSHTPQAEEFACTPVHAHAAPAGRRSWALSALASATPLAPIMVTHASHAWLTWKDQRCGRAGQYATIRGQSCLVPQLLPACRELLCPHIEALCGWC